MKVVLKIIHKNAIAILYTFAKVFRVISYWSNLKKKKKHPKVSRHDSGLESDHLQK